MYDDLNPKQIEILRYIQHCIQENGFAPSIREISNDLDIKSISAIYMHIARLEERGYLKHNKNKSRAFTLMQRQGAVDVPVVSKVTTSESVFDNGNVEDIMALPAVVAEHDNTYMLRVKGDSMMNAGILDGDYVIVNKQNAATPGAIIVAMIGDDVTIKTYYVDNGKVRLQPQNPSYEPILLDEVNVLGVVRGVLRVYDK